MKNALIQIGIILLAALCGYQADNIITEKEYNKKIEEIITIYTDDEAEQPATNYVNVYEGMDIAENSGFITDANGKSYNLQTLSGPKTICARFSANGCRPCIDTLTEALKDFASANPDWRINLLIDNVPLRDLFVMSKEFGSGFTLYSAANMPYIGNETNPVMFRVSQDGKIYRHFTCASDMPERTRTYVRLITAQ